VYSWESFAILLISVINVPSLLWPTLNKKFMSETISEKTLGKSSNTSNISEYDSLPDSIDFLVLSHSNITVEVEFSQSMFSGLTRTCVQ
jgi:hypothetical protein